VKLCPLSLLLALSFLAQVGLQAQTISPVVPSPGLPSPVVPAAEAPSALPPIERLATEAQQALFNAADRATNNSSKAPINLPGIQSKGRKTTFSAPKLEDPSSWKKDSAHKIATMTISFGGNEEQVMFELYPQDAPQTVSNFLDNCETGAYNGLAFHRAIQGFIVQTGDPLTSDEDARERWGTGGEGKTVPAEIKRTHRKGAVAMGRKADKVNPSRRSNGYQFYFALGNFASLDNNYTVFGQIIDGLDVIERIAKMPVDSNDCPVARIEIKNIRISDHKGPMYLNTASVDADGSPIRARPNSTQGPIGRLFRRIW
jgi:cyclophilin family peptidyl-prolyl cis-trans isomerase